MMQQVRVIAPKELAPVRRKIRWQLPAKIAALFIALAALAAMVLQMRPGGELTLARVPDGESDRNGKVIPPVLTGDIPSETEVWFARTPIVKGSEAVAGRGRELHRGVETKPAAEPGIQRVYLPGADQPDRAKAVRLVEEGKELYKAERLEEAQQRLQEAAKADPQNREAFYYSDLTQARKYDRRQHWRSRC